jgi:hypothetical protein
MGFLRDLFSRNQSNQPEETASRHGLYYIESERGFPATYVAYRDGRCIDNGYTLELLAEKAESMLETFIAVTNNGRGHGAHSGVEDYVFILQTLEKEGVEVNYPEGVWELRERNRLCSNGMCPAP